MRARIARILAHDNAAALPCIHFLSARYERRPIADIPADHWPAPHVAMDAARDFLGEDWCRLAHATADEPRVWIAVIGSGEVGGCAGTASTPEEAVVALWEDVFDLSPLETPPATSTRTRRARWTFTPATPRSTAHGCLARIDEEAAKDGDEAPDAARIMLYRMGYGDGAKGSAKKHDRPDYLTGWSAGNADAANSALAFCEREGLALPRVTR